MTLRKSWCRRHAQCRLLPCVGVVALSVAVGCTQPPQPVDENVPTPSALTNSLPVEEAIGPEVPTVMLGPGARPLTFAHVSPRTFRMGLSRPRWELWDRQSRITYEDGPPKSCTLSQPFYVATHEVTRAQWRAVFGSDPVLQPAADCDEHCPVDNITWWSAVAFADALSAREGLPTCYDGLGDACSGSAERGDLACELVESTLREFDPRRCEGYRLLTDAEWEAAARGGTETETLLGNHTEIRFEAHGLAREGRVAEATAFAGVEELAGPGRLRSATSRHGVQLNSACYDESILSRVGWYCDNASVENPQCGEVGVTQFTSDWACLGPQAVGQLTPNALGLYDVLGNAAEWVWDGYEPPPCAHENCPSVVDPILFPDSERRVLRGGSWRDGPFMLQAGVRTHAHRNTRAGGVRIGRSAPLATDRSHHHNDSR